LTTSFSGRVGVLDARDPAIGGELVDRVDRRYGLMALAP